MTLAETPTETDVEADALTIGRRIRQLRTAHGMTLDDGRGVVELAAGDGPSALQMLIDSTTKV